MEQNNTISVSRSKERIFLLLIGIVLALFFARLYFVIQRNFTEVDRRVAEGTIVNLNAGKPAQNIRRLLEKGFYFEDKSDIDLIERIIVKRITTGKKFDNIGELNKKKYNVDADEAFSNGGKSFKQRVIVSRALLGYTGDDSLRFIQEKNAPPLIAEVADLGLGDKKISGRILNQAKPVQGVLVRLQMILPQDSIYSDEEADQTKIKTELTPDIKRCMPLVQRAACICNH
jgi:hypothetical protein